MQAVALRILEKAALPPAQARAIAEVVDIEIASRSDVLATKADLQDVKSDMILRADLASLRAEMALAFANFEIKIVNLLRKSESDMMRWVFLNTLTIVVLIFGGVYFMITHMLPAR